MQEEMIKLQRLRLERFRQQEYLAQLAGNPNPTEKETNFAAMMRAMTSQQATGQQPTTQEEPHVVEDSPVAGVSGGATGLLNLLRKQTEEK